mgnify:FL=1
MLRTVPSCLPALDLSVLLHDLSQTTQHDVGRVTGLATLIATITAQIQHTTLTWDDAAVQLLLQEIALRNIDSLPANWLISTEQFAQWLVQQRRSPCN